MERERQRDRENLLDSDTAVSSMDLGYQLSNELASTLATRRMGLARDWAHLDRKNKFPDPRSISHFDNNPTYLYRKAADDSLFLSLRQFQHVNVEQTSTDLPAKPQLAKRRSYGQ